MTSRYRQVELRSLARRALDIQMTAKQSEALLDAEQPQAGLVLFLVIRSGSRLKPDALVAYLDMNGVVGPKLQVDIDSIDMSVLNSVKQQFANGFKEQDADVACFRVRPAVGR